MRRLGKTASGVIGLVTLIAMVAPVNAQAGPGKHGRGHHAQRSHHGGRAHGGQYRHRSSHHGSRGRAHGGQFGHRSSHHGSHGSYFAVPRHIGHRHRAGYSPYYQQRVYHRGHRHHHSIYRFQVSTGYGHDYRSYAYCDGALYSGYDHGLHVSLATRNFRVSYSGY